MRLVEPGGTAGSAPRFAAGLLEVYYNSFKLEVASKKTLNQEFLDFIGYYMHEEGFNEEARKYNLEWDL
jgi:hypothetical protein